MDERVRSAKIARMKAILISEFGGPEVLQLADVPDPQPGPGQVLVRIAAAGVNPVETYIRAGTYAKLPPLPYTPGSDGAGVVESVGADVESRLQPGQRVWVAGSVSGTYAEQAVCDSGRVFALPDSVTFEQGAALGIPYSTAWRALFQRGGAKAGETVLVHGATGGVGVAAVQFAKAAGLRVFATGGSEEGRQMLAGQGASAVFDHTSDGYMDGVLEATDGQGIGLIIEMLANVNLARDLGVLGRNGRVIVVGNRGTIEINPRDLMLRDADIRGVMVSNTPAPELALCHTAITEALASGKIKPVIGRILPLAEAAESHKTVLGSGHCGKVVLQTAPAR
jgi:NADPH2:quinone reductase